jgi:hypothetical protein
MKLFLWSCLAQRFAEHASCFCRSCKARKIWKRVRMSAIEFEKLVEALVDFFVRVLRYRDDAVFSDVVSEDSIVE